MDKCTLEKIDEELSLHNRDTRMKDRTIHGQISIQSLLVNYALFTCSGFTPKQPEDVAIGLCSSYKLFCGKGKILPHNPQIYMYTAVVFIATTLTISNIIWVFIIPVC